MRKEDIADDKVFEYYERDVENKKRSKKYFFKEYPYNLNIFGFFLGFKVYRIKFE